jgi:integrase
VVSVTPIESRSLLDEILAISAYAINAGCDVVTVQRALGHSSATITLGVYSHLSPNADDRTRNAAAALTEQSIGSAADALRTDG